MPVKLSASIWNHATPYAFITFLSLFHEAIWNSESFHLTVLDLTSGALSIENSNEALSHTHTHAFEPCIMLCRAKTFDIQETTDYNS